MYPLPSTPLSQQKISSHHSSLVLRGCFVIPYLHLLLEGQSNFEGERTFRRGGTDGRNVGGKGVRQSPAFTFMEDSKLAWGNVGNLRFPDSASPQVASAVLSVQ